MRVINHERVHEYIIYVNFEFRKAMVFIDFQIISLYKSIKMYKIVR